MRHFATRIQQAVVHIDVQDLRTGLYLTAGYADGFVVLPFLDQTEELARSGHVATLADIEKIECRGDTQSFQSRQGKAAVGDGRHARRHCHSGGSNDFGITGYVGIGRAAATAKDVDQSLLHKLAHLTGHVVRRLVVGS